MPTALDEESLDETLFHYLKGIQFLNPLKHAHSGRIIPTSQYSINPRVFDT
jgi:predicted oxidoreductase